MPDQTMPPEADAETVAAALRLYLSLDSRMRASLRRLEEHATAAEWSEFVREVQARIASAGFHVSHRRLAEQASAPEGGWPETDAEIEAMAVRLTSR